MFHLNFRPHFGLASPHLQTIVGSFRKAPPAPPSLELLVPLADGDMLSCQCSIPAQFSKIIVLIHGLGGSHNSNYMVRLARKCYDKGMMAVRVNLRGAGSGKNLSSRSYHGGRSEDVACVLHVLNERYPGYDVHVIGFSLGANIVLKLAAEQKVNAIAISPPVDLADAVKRIQQPKNRLYHAYYLKNIEATTKTLYEFDNTHTARLWGFSSADDYYKKSSSIHTLAAIKGPTKILFSEDDPFIAIPKLPHNPHVEVFCTRYGGHMGYIGKTAKEHTSFWLDELLLTVMIQ